MSSHPAGAPRAVVNDAPRAAVRETVRDAAAEVMPVVVEVTFLRMDEPPAAPGPALPADCRVELAGHCSVGFYRYLYAGVGSDYLWWFRRTVGDERLAAILASPSVSVHVLVRDGEPAGFYELERRPDGTANLSYFGLMPHAVGHGLGPAFLRHAVDAAWAGGTRVVTVNTCTADHPRALPNYLAAGFRVLRRVREDWPVPRSLGLRIPAHLPG